MGQQQLLLLVLGIVIVGIAVVAGIQAFSEGKAKAEQDAAVSDAMRIISDIQAWKLKPTAFGGGAESEGFSEVSFKALGYPVANANKYATYNGCYELVPGDSAEIKLFREGTTTVTDDNGTPLDASDDTKTTNCNANTPIADVTVSGSGTDDISWAYVTN